MKFGNNIKIILPVIVVLAVGFGVIFHVHQKQASDSASILITASDPGKFLSKGMLWDAAEPEKSSQKNVAPLKSVLRTSTQKTVEQPAILKICGGANATNFDCYGNYYKNLVAKKGIAAAMADLRARYKENSYVVSRCHPLTHVIGRTASEQFKNPGDAFDKGDSFCWSGYYHGVMEGIVARIGIKNLAASMDGICANVKGKESYSFDYYNCVHGLGHGVMELTDDELFKSLDYCDNLTGSWEQTSCASGAFMENVIADSTDYPTNYLKPDDPLYPCPESPEKYKYPCYLMQSSYILKVTGGDFLKTFGWCEKAEDNYRNICYESVGRDASGRSASNVLATKATCLLGTPGDQQEHCVIGAVKDFISYFHSDKQTKELCNSFIDQKLQSICLSTTESYYKSF